VAGERPRQAVALANQRVLLRPELGDPGRERLERGSGGPRALEAREDVLLLDEEALDGLAGLSERGCEPGLEAADLLGVGLDDDLEVVDLATCRALGRVVGRERRGRGWGGVLGGAAHGAARPHRELDRDLGGHAVEPLLADLDQRLPGQESRRGRLGQRLLGGDQL
jgi:hypothetical protein